MIFVPPCRNGSHGRYLVRSVCKFYHRGFEAQKVQNQQHKNKTSSTYRGFQGRPNKWCQFLEDCNIVIIRVLKFTQSALERQILESVKIQEERKKHLIMNSKAEYSRGTIPRLTTKMGDNEYDESRKKKKREEKEQEERVGRDIARRRKERCKTRNREIHEPRKERMPRRRREKRQKKDCKRKEEREGKLLARTMSIGY